MPTTQLTSATTLQAKRLVTCLAMVHRVGAVSGDGTLAVAKWDGENKVCQAKVVRPAPIGSSGGTEEEVFMKSYGLSEGMHISRCII